MKNFLKVITIILSLSVAFLIGISNCSALSSNFGSIGYSDINTSGISSLTGATSNYVLIYEDDIQSVGGIWLFFLNSNTAYLSTNNLSSDYINDICSTEGGCFNRLYSSAGTNPKLGYKYYSLDNGNTWVLYSSATNHLSTDPLPYSYIVYTTANLKNVFNTSSTLYSSGYYYDAPISSDFNVDFEQGEVIIKDSGGAIANLVTYYVEPTFEDFVPDNYIFSYIENTTGGGFRDSYQFNLTYNENGITYNGNTYHYYYNLPLSYNTGLTFSINDLEHNLIQENQFTAYLSSLTDISGYTMYDFRNYEFANMSDINTGLFGLSYQLNTNITINAINYNTNTKIDFLNSSYLINSNTDNNGVTWYEFNFNNDPIYLEFINNFNDTSDFYTYIDTYNLYLYFDNNSYVHLSGSPNSIESQDNVVNQQSYKDNQGNIIYNNNPIVIDIDNSNEFFQNLQRYFKDFDTDTFGLTGIITSPLNLIQNLLSDTCNPLVVPIPYVNSTLTLPCMNTIYSQYFGGFYTIYQDITFGIVAYWVVVRILNMVKDFRNPDHDEIEVLDL